VGTSVKHQFALNAAVFRGDDRLVDHGERSADAAADFAREHAQSFQLHLARMIHDRGRLPADEPSAPGVLAVRSTILVHARE
jgi:hypothetical protein